MFFVKFAASALNDVPGEKYEKNICLLLQFRTLWN
jgi:hypothetical protein